MSVRREKRVTKKRTLSVYIPIECRASVVVGGGIGRQGKGKKATTASGFSFAANSPLQPALRVLQMARNRSNRANGGMYGCTSIGLRIDLFNETGVHDPFNNYVFKVIICLMLGCDVGPADRNPCV